ncbi:hypothetical protein HYH02_008388 [Chlamydomonas schloesseri]|uniref:FCP1 homology domain-containing protein n=1 Tax=Chlamydomonas schloesseri TaxID=2026947 RepID=A0A836B433_9CHLO|nr:hypothetical protein HYH02_008388 [Chlamydomonas schloesseri]|eukprot:KAG2446828.1 hypothetical protein HYH02_008388 [Chlamydomonas schloesseri]
MLIVLVGLPGAGKTFLARRLVARGNWRHVSQDELGSRRACEQECAGALRQGWNVVVDRCNFDEQQRSHWVQIARCCRSRQPVQMVAVQLLLPLGVCRERARGRTDHPTLGPHNCDEVISRFAADFVHVRSGEGFHRVVTARSSQEAEALVDALAAEADDAAGTAAVVGGGGGGGAAWAPGYADSQPQANGYGYQGRQLYASPAQPGHGHYGAPPPGGGGGYCSGGDGGGGGSQGGGWAAAGHGGGWQGRAAASWDQGDGYDGTSRTGRADYGRRNDYGGRDDYGGRNEYASHGAYGGWGRYEGDGGYGSQAAGAFANGDSSQQGAWPAAVGNGYSHGYGHGYSHSYSHGGMDNGYSHGGMDNGALGSSGHASGHAGSWWGVHGGGGGGGAAVPSHGRGPGIGQGGGGRGAGGGGGAGTRSANKAVEASLRPQFADPGSTVPYDIGTRAAAGGPAAPDPRPVLLFDLNGTLTSHTSARHSSGTTRLRPGAGELLTRLAPHFRLGIYTSSKLRTVSIALQLLEADAAAAAGGGGGGGASAAAAPACAQVFERGLILHREHTVPAPKGHVDAGGDPWDTLKPLGRYFGRLHRLGLVDDDAYKAMPGESANMLLLPCWRQEDPSCRVLQRLGDLLLQRLVGLPADADVRPHLAAISEQLRQEAAEAAGAAGEAEQAAAQTEGGNGESDWFQAFGIVICSQCKRDEPLISKANALSRYCLTPKDLQDLGFITKDNPQKKGWSAMKLYLRSQVEERARRKHGDMDSIQQLRHDKAQAKVRGLLEKRARAAAGDGEEEEEEGEEDCEEAEAGAGGGAPALPGAGPVKVKLSAAAARVRARLASEYEGGAAAAPAVAPAAPAAAGGGGGGTGAYGGAENAAGDAASAAAAADVEEF